ncbi:MAG: hypothetical protein JJU40_08390, partial [Rhodobacteraceae bacterium]|nr:hypothetical protein [Paracoccaceae bacterium]
GGGVHGGPGPPPPPPDDPDSALAVSLRATEAAAARLEAARRAHGTAREQAAAAQVRAAEAARRLERAEEAAGPPDGREAMRADLLREHAAAEEAHAAAAGALAALERDAPDLASLQAGHARAEAALRAVNDRRTALTRRIDEAGAVVTALAGDDVEAKCAAIAGELEAARAREARLAAQARAHLRLRAALEEARDAARDAYFGPVQQELAPLLALVHGQADLAFDSATLLPSALVRAGAEEQMDALSGGTREQIAILTRLAFARLFARRGQHIPIVLDDALVFSDDARIVQMFTALTRVAMDQQILVFSCRQLAFQDLGGARPLVEVRPAG